MIFDKYLQRGFDIFRPIKKGETFDEQKEYQFQMGMLCEKYNKILEKRKNEPNTTK